MKRPSVLTLSASLAAVSALRELHRICVAMDADEPGCQGASKGEYRSALRRASVALSACPRPEVHVRAAAESIAADNRADAALCEVLNSGDGSYRP